MSEQYVQGFHEVIFQWESLNCNVVDERFHMQFWFILSLCKSNTRNVNY